jgi:hypothetical protein
MRTSTLTPISIALYILVSLAIAAPISSCNSSAISSSFYLVTTSSSECSSNSTLLPSVSATSLFDPSQQPNYLLRLIAPGYFSLPNFTLTDGVLQSVATTPFGLQSYLYNSTPPAVGTELQFSQSVQGNGGLGLLGGYLLAVNGSGVGWTVCSGPLGESVVSLFTCDIRGYNLADSKTD